MFFSSFSRLMRKKREQVVGKMPKSQTDWDPSSGITRPNRDDLLWREKINSEGIVDVLIVWKVPFSAYILPWYE